MTEERADPRAPGWKRDPSRRFTGRYWDGTGWTEHVVTDGVRSTDPLPTRPQENASSSAPTARPPVQPAPPAAPTAPAPVQPAPQAAPASASRNNGRERRQAVAVILGGAALIVLGCFLPWVTVRAPSIGSVSRTGMDGDGVLFVILAGLLALLPFDLWRGVPDSLSRMRWGLGGVIALLALLTLFEARDLTSRFSDIAAEADVVRTSYGLGFWLVGLGVLVAAVGWLRLPWRSLNEAA